MDSDQICALLARHEERFGDESTAFLDAPNWLTDPRLGPLLEAALQAGRPLTEAEVAAALGAPFREEVI